MGFEGWLAELLGQSESEVRKLLKSKIALHFLVAWSIFESKCFGGFVKIEDLYKFSQRVAQESFQTDSLSAIANHFHNRYQDHKLYRNLMHEQSCNKMETILAKDKSTLTDQEIIFLVALTVYRFRNNIFHGNKGVTSWLKFNEQITHCTHAMQAFVAHAESLNPSLCIASSK